MRKSHEVLLEKIYWFSSYEPKTLGGGLRGPPPWLLGLRLKWAETARNQIYNVIWIFAGRTQKRSVLLRIGLPIAP